MTSQAKIDASQRNSLKSTATGAREILAERDAGAGDAGGNSRDVSDADAVANGGDGMSPRGENRENDTNEAKFDESVINIQSKEPVGVAANSAVDSGLDNGQEH